MKKYIALLLFVVVFLVSSCNSVKTDSDLYESGDDNEYLSNKTRYSVLLKDQAELVNWWKNTDVTTAYEGQFKELKEWKTVSGKLIVPYNGEKELSDDISIIPESTYEAAGMYFRYYTDEVTCIVQVYQADPTKLYSVRDNLCWYRLGKNTMKEPTDISVGTVALDGMEVAYGLAYSEPMARQYLTFLYDERYIVTLAYMDSSKVSLWNFLEDLRFVEVSV